MRSTAVILQGAHLAPQAEKHLLAGSGADCTRSRGCARILFSGKKFQNVLRFAALARPERHYFREQVMKEKVTMLRNTMIALFAIASIGMPDAVSAHGGHGGSAGGHFGGGGFHGGGFRGRGFGVGGFYGDYPYYYDDDYYDDGGCYLVRRRVHTHHGWRWRTIEVCG